MYKNQKGFAAVEIILIFIVLAAVSGAGYYVWQHTHARKPAPIVQKQASVPVKSSGPPSGEFVDDNPGGQLEPYSKIQSVGYIGITVQNNSNVSKIEWYIGNFNPSSLAYSSTTPAAVNSSEYSGIEGDSALWQYDWPLPVPGTYRFMAKVYDKSGNAYIVTAPPYTTGTQANPIGHTGQYIDEKVVP